MNQQELDQFLVLAKKYEPSNLEAVSGAVKDHMHAVFQQIHDQGHSAATQKSQGKEKTLGDAKKAAEEKVAELERQLTELNGKTPDLKQLQERHDAAITDLKNKHRESINGLKDELKNTRIGTVREKVVSHLAGELGVDYEYADLVLLNKPEVAGRFKPNETGVVEILQAGKDIPFVPTDNKTVVALLAEELAATVPDKFKTATVRRGSATRGSAGGAGETGKSRFDKAREEVMGPTDKEKPARDPHAGLARLGGRSR